MADESTGTAEAEAAPVTDGQDFGSEWNKAQAEESGKTETAEEVVSTAEGETDSEVTTTETEEETTATETGDKDKGADDTKDDEAAKIVKEREATEAFDAAVRQVHPDTDKILGDPRFDAWWATLSAEDRKKGEPGCTALEAASLITRFKDELAAGKVPDAAETGDQDWFKEVGADDIRATEDEEEVDLAQLGEKYSGFKAMTQLIQKVRASILAEIEAVRAENQSLNTTVADVTGRIGELDLLRAHSDATKIEKTKAFAEYKAKQPEPFRRLWDKGSAKDRIAFLTRYKEDTARGLRKPSTETANRQALHESTMPGTSTGHESTISEGTESFSEEWKRQLAAEKESAK